MKCSWRYCAPAPHLIEPPGRWRKLPKSPENTASATNRLSRCLVSVERKNQRIRSGLLVMLTAWLNSGLVCPVTALEAIPEENGLK